MSDLPHALLQISLFQVYFFGRPLTPWQCGSHWSACCLAVLLLHLSWSHVTFCVVSG